MTIEERLARIEQRLEDLELQLAIGAVEVPSLEEHHARTVERVKLARERGGLNA